MRLDLALLLCVGGILMTSETFAESDGATVSRIFRPARLVRGNVGVFDVQSIDRASWVTHPDLADEAGDVSVPRVLRFRREFESDGTPFEIDVTADERFLLFLDGTPFARGPHRGSVENWMYQSYRLTPTAGRHLLEAVVWKLPPGGAPLAQMSWRLVFCLKASDAYDKTLTTGKATWKVGMLDGLRCLGKARGAFGVGSQFELAGTGPFDAKPVGWKSASVIRGPVRNSNVGLRLPGWLLYPSQLPDQIANRIRPGRFVSVGEMKFPIVVPAGETRTILWDLDRYVCAYPEAVVRGGRGGCVEWRWAESLVGPEGKGRRDEWQGKSLEGLCDRFLPDGRARAVFMPPWFRCGRWCELRLAAGDEPLTVESLALVETRYPLACETEFVSPDDPALADVQRICARTMQMCCHEMLFDCPFFEQQMYPGDTRVQLNVISSMTSDDRIIRRAIELFDLNRRDDGNVPFNFPTTGTQEGASYTLCYLGMYRDYLMNHADRDWLRARLPGLRATLSGLELYEGPDGLLVNLPGWNFLDWVPDPRWPRGWAPGTWERHEANAELNCLYLLGLLGAAEVERAFGNEHLAAHWNEKAVRLRRAVEAAFFDADRGLFASDASHTVFSEHAQCLALLADVVTGERADAVFGKLVSDTSLCPVSIYFSYYLFETLFKFKRPDVFLKRLDLWKDSVAKGATTCLEKPECPGRDSRSDCHAWGAHPLWFLRTGIAGIRSAAPFFERVRIAPQPAGLRQVRSSYPHPQGKPIAVDLQFSDGRVRGSVETPVPGVFEFAGKRIPLTPGTNRLP